MSAASILIVDDDPRVCAALSEALATRGYAVETATRGGLALERLDARQVDAAILDIMLPDVPGLELLSAIKTRSPDTEVIFITGHASLPTALQAVNGAAFAYLVKPFALDHLLATVAKALDKQRLARALRDSEERYRLITENISDAVLLLDLEGRVVFGTRRGEEVLGRSLDDVRGRPLALFLDAAGAQEISRRLVADPVATSGSFESAIVRADGRSAWVAVNLAGLVKEDRAVALLAVLHDVTANRRAAADLLQQREALFQTEKLAAMGSLLAGVAHELNNPLSVVLGQTVLIRETVGEGPIATRADKIAQAAERCARIVRNFLALARRHPPERRRLRLDQVVRDALDLLTYSLRVDGVGVTLALTPEVPPILADHSQLQQVVVNLVSNAQQAMREVPGSRRLTLTTGHDALAGRAWLEVADTGPGIVPAIRGRIFEPFFTTRPTGEGTGLGLPLCQGIAETHGGTVQVVSRPGPGAVFRVELPVAPPGEDVLDVWPEPGPRSLLRRRRILVVEDEVQVAQVLAELLTIDGHEVETAANGVEALEHLSTQPFDLIVSDLRMPELDGPGLYREVARRWPAQSRRFVFLTGDTTGEEATRLLETTGTLCLQKPLALEEVRAVVDRALVRQGLDRLEG